MHSSIGIRCLSHIIERLLAQWSAHLPHNYTAMGLNLSTYNAPEVISSKDLTISFYADKMIFVFAS